MKIYLCGITHDNLENIKQLTEVYQDFDGLIFVDGGSTDGTKELLESRKKEGAIIHRKWTNDHDFQMNEFLRQGPLKLGDWFIIRDSRERLNPNWTKNIKNLIHNFKSNSVRSVYNSGKGFAFEYFDDMFFFGTPHWGLLNARQNSIDLSHFFNESEKEHTWRLKDGEGGRKESDFIDHFVKYYYIYGRSNHMLLGRENNKIDFENAENNRINFRIYCNYLGLDFTLESLKNYLSKEDWKKDKVFLSMFNQEEILKNFYRWHILNHKIEDIKNTSKTWNL